MPWHSNRLIKAEISSRIIYNSLSWNDYSDIDVSGKWVLILRGSPDKNNPHGSFSEHSSLRKKVMIAKDHSAAGVVFTSGSKFDESDTLIPLRYDQSQINVSIPVIHVKREVADLILNKSGGSLVSLENNVIQMKEKFKSIELKKIVSVSTAVKYKTVQTQNIVGILPGIDEKLKNEYVVMGAHYDHLGFGGEHSGSRRPDHYEIHNGADDNASGVSVMMELAKLFSHNNTNKRTLVFVGFGAEEMGLLGSKHFVKSGIIKNDNIQIMLNMVMVGRWAIGNPWIFGQIEQYLDDGRLLPDPTVSERMKLAIRHLHKSIKAKGPKKGIYELRRSLAAYIRGLPGAKEIKPRMMTEEDPDRLAEMLSALSIPEDQKEVVV